MSEAPKSIARVLITGSTYSTAFSALAAMSDPYTDLTSGRAVVRMGDATHLAIMFAGTAAQNKDFAYRVIGFMEAGPVDDVAAGHGLLPVLLAQGVVTLGNTAVGAQGGFVEIATSKFADTITEALGSNYAAVHSPANDRIGLLAIDAAMFRYVAIDVTLDSASDAAATMDVIAMRGCDSVSNATFAAAAGAATAAKQDSLLAAVATAAKQDALVAIVGATTGTVVGDNTTVCDATAATGIGLWKRIVNLLIAILAAAAKALTTASSVLYDGGGTGNALQESIATSALPAGAAVIATGANNLLEIFLTTVTATQTVTLNVVEYSAAIPTIATEVGNTAVAMGSDLVRTVDRACVGLTTNVEHFCKAVAKVAVTPGRYVQISIQENITGLAYCRYSLKGAV